jgi:hypothetical protein
MQMIPMMVRRFGRSPKAIMPNRMARTKLNLSMGATTLRGPSLIALK